MNIGRSPRSDNRSVGPGGLMTDYPPGLSTDVLMKADKSLTPAERIAKARRLQWLNEQHQKSLRRKHRNAKTEKARLRYADQLAAAVRSGEKIAMRLERLEQENIMINDLPWRVALGSLNIEGVLYPRGSIVPDAVVDRSLNGQRLISTGYLRRMPAVAAKEPRNNYEKSRENYEPYVPVDHIKVLYDAMFTLAAQRGCPISEVEDVVDRTLWERAAKQWVDEPKMALSQSWGGNNHLTPSGVGTARRIFDPVEFGSGCIRTERK